MKKVGRMRRNTRPASPGGLPYKPDRCVAAKKGGERCKGRPVTGEQECSFHANKE